MKTIKVTNKMYNSLMELSKEMTSQDPMCTRMPHMFQIRVDTQVAAYEGNGEAIYVDEDGYTYESEEDVREFISHDLFDSDESDLSDDDSKIAAKEKASKMNEDEIEYYMENHRINFQKVSVEILHTYKNTFFTKKACQEHIDANDYHYNNPKVYLNHAWRNPEMDLVSKFLCEISGGKLHT